MAEVRLHYRRSSTSSSSNALGGSISSSPPSIGPWRRSSTRTSELAELVIADDDRIDGRYLEVHQEILTLLATQAPVATDLRLISALLHVMHSDRADGRSVREHLQGHPADRARGAGSTAEMIERILLMGKQARSMLSQAKKAFERRDVELARDLVRQDDLIDNLNKECFQIAVQVGEDQDTREWAMTMMLVARAIERIGDNAVDIGEQVAFVVTGLFREFEDASHPGKATLPAS